MNTRARGVASIETVPVAATAAAGGGVAGGRAAERLDDEHDHRGDGGDGGEPAPDHERLRRAALPGRDVCACASVSWPRRALPAAAGRATFTSREISRFGVQACAGGSRCGPARPARHASADRRSAGGAARVDRRRQVGGRLDDGRHVGLVRSRVATDGRRRRLGGGGRRPRRFDGGLGRRQVGGGGRPPAAAASGAGAGGAGMPIMVAGSASALAGGARHQVGDDVRRGDQAGAGDGFVERGLRVDRRRERPAEAERARQPADDGRVERLGAAVAGNLLGAVQQRRERRRILAVVDGAAADERQAEIAELIDVRQPA